MITTNVEFCVWPGGCSYRVVWYDDETGQEAAWYGSQEECVERSKKAPPRLSLLKNKYPQLDHATQTGMYDWF